jgi:hypothetical protein
LSSSIAGSTWEVGGSWRGSEATCTEGQAQAEETRADTEALAAAGAAIAGCCRKARISVHLSGHSRDFLAGSGDEVCARKATCRHVGTYLHRALSWFENRLNSGKSKLTVSWLLLGQFPSLALRPLLFPDFHFHPWTLESRTTYLPDIQLGHLHCMTFQGGAGILSVVHHFCPFLCFHSAC